MLLMLEDNAERVDRFTATLKRIDPGVSLRVWRNAWTMIREVEAHLPRARLISLDHDLDPEEGNPDDPISGGALCARGQAAVQSLYAADRFQGPMLRGADRQRSLHIAHEGGLSVFGGPRAISSTRRVLRRAWTETV